MSGSDILKHPDVSGRSKTSEYLYNYQIALPEQQAACNKIYRESIENDFIKGFIVASAISIPIWAIIISVINIFFF